MFFIGIFGTNAKVVPAGRLSELACPACGKQARLDVFKKYQYFHAFFLPLVKYGMEYFSTCPGCASVFGLDRELGRELEKSGTLTVPLSALRLIRSNHTPRCPICGARQPQGSVFCNQCGAKL